eukprot:scaffold89387_cov62-Phaeocystis_antarctica.AAC.3
MRPFCVFQCTAASVGAVAQLAIVSQGTGLPSKSPWQKSSTQTRSSKSGRFGSSRSTSSSRRSSVCSRRADVPWAVSLWQPASGCVNRRDLGETCSKSCPLRTTTSGHSRFGVVLVHWLLSSPARGSKSSAPMPASENGLSQ